MSPDQILTGLRIALASRVICSATLLVRVSMVAKMLGRIGENAMDIQKELLHTVFHV